MHAYIHSSSDRGVSDLEASRALTYCVCMCTYKCVSVCIQYTYTYIYTYTRIYVSDLEASRALTYCVRRGRGVVRGDIRPDDKAPTPPKPWCSYPSSAPPPPECIHVCAHPFTHAHAAGRRKVCACVKIHVCMCACVCVCDRQREHMRIRR